MTVGSLYLDVTEVVQHPLRSGIQRVEREAIRHWAGPMPTPCVIDAGGRVVRLAGAVLDVLQADTDGSPAARAVEREKLAALRHAGSPVADDAVGRLLNLELFFAASRADAYLRLAGRGVPVLFYIYDFLPFLRPELFEPSTPQACMHFLRAVRSAGDRVAFLSRSTRDDFARRIARRPPPAAGWPVFDPGADGLGLERQVFRPDRRSFVSIGTMERRKNTEAVLDAFDLLHARGVPAELVLAGRIAPGQDRVRALAAQGHPRLRVLEEPTDEALRAVLREARAVVMPSEAEGFGLPPYEAAHAGIAAIASRHLPSAALLTSGALLLDRMDPPSIAAAVESLLDDDVAAELWQAAAGLRLPVWQDFGRGLSAWARQDAG